MWYHRPPNLTSILPSSLADRAETDSTVFHIYTKYYPVAKPLWMRWWNLFLVLVFIEPNLEAIIIVLLAMRKVGLHIHTEDVCTNQSQPVRANPSTSTSCITKQSSKTVFLRTQLRFWKPRCQNQSTLSLIRHPIGHEGHTLYAQCLLITPAKGCLSYAT